MAVNACAKLPCKNDGTCVTGSAGKFRCVSLHLLFLLCWTKHKETGISCLVGELFNTRFSAASARKSTTGKGVNTR